MSKDLVANSVCRQTDRINLLWGGTTRRNYSSTSRKKVTSLTGSDVHDVADGRPWNMKFHVRSICIYSVVPWMDKTQGKNEIPFRSLLSHQLCSQVGQKDDKEAQSIGRKNSLHFSQIFCWGNTIISQSVDKLSKTLPACSRWILAGFENTFSQRQYIVGLISCHIYIQYCLRSLKRVCFLSGLMVTRQSSRTSSLTLSLSHHDSFVSENK